MSEFRRLHYFLAVAEHLNFRRAAEELEIAQPSLSQQIRALEADLGFELFERNRRQVNLTKAGAEYLVGVRNGLAEFEAVARRSRAARDGLRGTLSIGTAGMLMIEHMPRIVRAFRSDFPDVDLTLTIMRNPDLFDALRRGRVELAFTTGNPADPQIGHEPLWSFSSRVVLPADHALAASSAVRLSELSGETLIVHPHRGGGSSANGVVMALCREHGFVAGAVREVPEIADLESLVGLVACGLGVTILPSPFELLICSAMVHFKPIRDVQNDGQLSAYWRKDERSQLISNFLDVAHRVGADSHMVAIRSKHS
ncbi:MAG: LysR family transcriptional regulator [Candidatus Lustribacter sp.]|jgi:DNA-binding transcriptional LysR family regulator